MKKLFLSTLLLALPLLASAYDCQVDGIYYNLNSEKKTAEVTYQKVENGNYSSDYSGSVVIPEKFTYEGVEYSVTSIGDHAFDRCSGLTSVTIPNSVTSIGDDTFWGCSGLNSVHIADLAAWCKIAFNSSTSNPLSCAQHLYLNGEEIKDLVIPNSVTSIGNYAFEDCSGLTSVTIPNSVTSIGKAAFSGCTGLTSVTIPNSVTSIGDYAFSNCTGLTSVTIPNSVTSISSYTFSNCSNLTSVTLPNTLTTIGVGAFRECHNLATVNIPKTVNSIGQNAFSECFCLTSVDIPESVTCIEKSTFENCRSLTSVTIPNSVTTIGYYAFFQCSGLTSVTIPNSVTTIGNYAFFQCSGLTSVTIPNSMTYIGNNAFQECTGLTSVTIPNSVTNIGYEAFRECSGLTSVHITDLAAWCKIAFNRPTSNPLYYAHHLYLNGKEIKDLVIPISVTNIGNYAFYGCSGLTSVTIPNSVTSIGDYAFYRCFGLTSVTIPNSMTSIGNWAFNGCSGLTSVTIGNSVTSIGDYAFYGCVGLTTVISEMEIPCSIDENCFSADVFNNSTLYVPKGTVDKYKSTDYWNKFVFIEESDDSGEQGGDAEMVDLCIQDSEKGELTIGLEKGKSHTLTITPENGWKVYMIIFNNKNVTAQLNGNKFIIPALTGKSYLNISYEQTSDVNSAKTIPMLISAHEGKITVNSEAEGQTVNAYTMDGKALGSGVIRNGKAKIQTNQPSGEPFIVKAGTRSVKMLMK